ncbi:MAG TPA: PIN domain-containing protein [Planctomycetota bacterium]|nr:PIN domain-containing protein [Planctomycetota bacterium]HRR79134.1 PIN domain-containing protein [Planctomycetota bacterium]HRT96362.1 PIN domain-containing protein [Planctomycetota bacterium]
MNIVIDTCVWSLVLRRPRPDAANEWVRAFHAHVTRGDEIHLIGPILEELLEGLRLARDFDRLVEALRSFPLVPLGRDTYVAAARLRNACQRRGVQAGHTDALIAAACIEQGLPLLTSDTDFARIAEHCELILLPPLPA